MDVFLHLLDKWSVGLFFLAVLLILAWGSK